MSILILCVLAAVLIALLYRLCDIMHIDYTYTHKSKLYKRVAGLMVITVCLMIHPVMLVFKEIFN